MITEITRNVNELNELAGSLTLFIPTVIGLCSVVSSIIPKPTKAGVLSVLYKVLNVLGCNFGHAANKQ